MNRLAVKLQQVFSEKASKFWQRLEWIVPIFLAGRMVSFWLSEFGLLPDSTFYLCAAKNLVRTGKFMVYTNFPSFNFEPVMEIYSEYPPGFPLYLVPFILIFRDPLLAGAISQGISILGLFLVTVPLFRSFGFHWLLRLSGYAFLAFFISFREIYKTLFSEPLFLWVTLGTFYFSIQRSEPERKRLSDWIWGGLLLASGTAIKFIGVFNFSLWIFPILLSRNSRFIKGFSLLSCSLLPAGLWLGRNYVLFGKMTRTHLEDWSQDPRDFLYPFFRTVSVMAYNRWIVVAVFGILLVSPFIFLFVSNLRREKTKQIRLINHATSLLGASSHLVGIALLSNLFRMDFLDHRLLSPSYLMIGIALLSSISILSRVLLPYSQGLFLLPIFYLGTNPMFRNPLPDFNLSHFDRPKHESLWKELNRMEDLKQSTHFYTNIDFLHQVFCDQPHKILWNANYADTAEKTGWLLHYGRRPYFVIGEGDPLVTHLESQKAELGLTHKQVGGFALFCHASGSDSHGPGGRSP